MTNNKKYYARVYLDKSDILYDEIYDSMIEDCLKNKIAVRKTTDSKNEDISGNNYFKYLDDKVIQSLRKILQFTINEDYQDYSDDKVVVEDITKIINDELRKNYEINNNFTNKELITIINKVIEYSSNSISLFTCLLDILPIIHSVNENFESDQVLNINRVKKVVWKNTDLQIIYPQSQKQFIHSLVIPLLTKEYTLIDVGNIKTTFDEFIDLDFTDTTELVSLSSNIIDIVNTICNHLHCAADEVVILDENDTVVSY